MIERGGSRDGPVVEPPPAVGQGADPSRGFDVLLPVSASRMPSSARRSCSAADSVWMVPMRLATSGLAHLRYQYQATPTRRMPAKMNGRMLNGKSGTG